VFVLIGQAFKGNPNPFWSYSVAGLGTFNILLAVDGKPEENPVFRLGLKVSVMAMVEW